MKFTIETRSYKQWSASLIVLPFLDGKLISHPSIASLHQQLADTLPKLLAQEDFKGEVGESRLFPTYQKKAFDYILVMGLGKSKELNAEAFCKASARSAQAADRLKLKRIVSLLSLAKPVAHSFEALGRALSEGVHLGLYQFNLYKSQKKEGRSLQQIDWYLADAKHKADLQEGLKQGDIVSQGVILARDLVNTPSLDKPPSRLAKEAQKLPGIRSKVFDHRKIKEMGMGALYGVGQGSSNPPVFVEMHYKPAGRVKKRIAIVGKGIVFDSGGLSLKPPKSMETMKDDMAGAAAVLGVMKALPQLKLPVEVYGYVTSAENMPDGAAQRPGDVVKAYNGKTIEVLNTDAEGRLALADALSYIAKHREVDYVIDIATLTGAALVALGDLYTAALGTDSNLIAKLKEAGESCGEKIWELPLAPEYEDEIKSPTADIQNIGGPYGGTINGAIFLKHFIPENAKWAHLDIAGPSWANKPWVYSPKGGTGIMVRTLLKWMEGL